MERGALGKVYRDGEAIVRQGEMGNCMYMIQSGTVEVVQEQEGRHVRLTTLGEGDIFGEMALFEQQPRSATVRAVGEARVLTIDKRVFFRQVHRDPTLAFNVLKKMSKHIRDTSAELTQLKAELDRIQGKDRPQ